MGYPIVNRLLCSRKVTAFWQTNGSHSELIRNCFRQHSFEFIYTNGKMLRLSDLPKVENSEFWLKFNWNLPTVVEFHYCRFGLFRPVLILHANLNSMRNIILFKKYSSLTFVYFSFEFLADKFWGKAKTNIYYIYIYISVLLFYFILRNFFGGSLFLITVKKFYGLTGNSIKSTFL